MLMRKGPRRRHKGGGQKLDFHKWNVSFSGADDKSVNSFIQDVEEKARSKNIDKRYLLQGATEFLTGVAKTWYRSIESETNSWEELKLALRREFLPLDYEESLWEEIRGRKTIWTITTINLRPTFDLHCAMFCRT